MSKGHLHDAEVALAQGDVARGERLVRRALVRAPNDARANELMALVLASRGDEEGAMVYLRTATAQAAASAAAWHQLGTLLNAKGERESARLAFHQALLRDGGFFPAHHDLGRVLHDLGRLEDSLEALDRAVAIAPESFEAHHNRGRILNTLRRHEEAVESYDRALAIRADHAPTLLNRGESLAELRRYDAALADYGRAVQVVPSFDDARWNESLLRLLLGQFESGWPLYECRWSGSMAWPRRHHGIPRWSGGPDVHGKRVLVWWEQGFGDTLHFCRYLPMLAARGAHVVFEAQAPLARLMHSLQGGIEVIASGERTGACDYQIPLLSLPLAFKTTLETIPAQVPYLCADPALVEKWRAQLGPGPKIGVACSGHASQKDNVARSLPLSALAPLARLADVFVVQVDVGAEDRDFAKGHDRFHLLEGRIGDFSDTAAIIENMTAVVTVDTAVAHLAGALAKPTWIMLPWTPTWRWMIDRDDSPWYPTARLVRQKDKRDWHDVVERVEGSLVSALIR